MPKYFARIRHTKENDKGNLYLTESGLDNISAGSKKKAMSIAVSEAANIFGATTFKGESYPQVYSINRIKQGKVVSCGGERKITNTTLGLSTIYASRGKDKQKRGADGRYKGTTKQTKTSSYYVAPYTRSNPISDEILKEILSL